jgi:homocitrate synthase NifV
LTASGASGAPLLVEDSTLREGEQSPGVVFTVGEKVHIARLLESIGVRAMEMGTAAMGGPEEEAVRALVGANLRMRLIGWNRGVRSDLERSFACGVDSVHIGLPASDAHIERKFGKSRDWVVETMQELVAYAKAQGAWVSVSAEDVGRADADFLVRYARAVAEAGADRMRLSDTIGVLDPFQAERLFRQIAAQVPIPLQAHMHNDYGLATANTLAAVRGGARHVHVTVNGLGERAGIAPLDEVAMGLRKHLDIDPGIRTEALCEVCEYVAAASGRPIPANKPVTGRSAFEHESGIHVDGMLKVADSFEPFPPELVGARRSIVIGKHSGSAAVQYVLASLGVQAEREDLADLVQVVRYESTRRKRALTPDEVVELHRVTRASPE